MGRFTVVQGRMHDDGRVGVERQYRWSEEGESVEGPWTEAEIEEALRGYDPTVFARWYVTLNVWGWPDDCPLPCPRILRQAQLAYRQCADEVEGWAAFRAVLGVQEHRALHRPLMAYLACHTDRADISRYWWLHHLHRTEEEWETWWAQETNTEARALSLQEWHEEE